MNPRLLPLPPKAVKENTPLKIHCLSLGEQKVKVKMDGEIWKISFGSLCDLPVIAYMWRFGYPQMPAVILKNIKTDIP
jgi:hypothetical protein